MLMSLEIEIKLRVDDFESLRNRLSEIGACHQKTELELNTFFDLPDGDLRRSSRGLRLRRAQDLSTGQLSVKLTYKGPRQAGLMKIRPELELQVDSYDTATSLLQALGYQIGLSFEKHRETWQLGECEIVLDELPADLGRYVEIEGPDQDRVLHCREQLALTQHAVEPRSYASIVSAHLGKDGPRLLAFSQP